MLQLRKKEKRRKITEESALEEEQEMKAAVEGAMQPLLAIQNEPTAQHQQ